jgi:hypothetical protein
LTNINKFSVGFCLILLASLPAGAVGESMASEYALKTAIVYKIVKFVSWPEAASTVDTKPLYLCVPESDPIASAMDALSGETAHGRPIEIRRLGRASSLPGDCNILYMSRRESARHTTLLAHAADAPVLTIGDSKGFVKSGGIVALEIRQSRVQFAINTNASQRAGLRISAQLLQLARIDDGG